MHIDVRTGATSEATQTYGGHGAGTKAQRTRQSRPCRRDRYPAETSQVRLWPCERLVGTRKMSHNQLDIRRGSISRRHSMLAVKRAEATDQLLADRLARRKWNDDCRAKAARAVFDGPGGGPDQATGGRKRRRLSCSAVSAYPQGGYRSCGQEHGQASI